MKLPDKEIQKIVVFRALQLGDMLCAIPAIRALRNCFPDAEISLLGLPWAKFLVDRFPNYFDRFIHFPGYPGLPEQSFDAKNFLVFLSEMQHEQFDLVLQMQGNGTIVNPMVELFAAKYTAGFYLEGDYAPNTDFFISYPSGIHEIQRHLSLMEYIGVPSLGTDLEFPILAQDEKELASLQLPFERKKYVCVHPGSRGSWRQWPPKYFALLCDYCAEQGYRVVLTGTKEELPVVNEVKARAKKEVLVAAGRTSIGGAAALIKNAFALISNCTGVSHIAAAVKTPSIVLSMDGEPERWAPLNKQLHYTIDWTRTPDFSIVFDSLKNLIVHMAQRNQFRDEQIIVTE